MLKSWRNISVRNWICSESIFTRKKKLSTFSPTEVKSLSLRMNRRQETDERFHLISGNRITYKSHCLSSHNIKKFSCIKTRKFTLVRLPSPVEKISVLSPLQETVLRGLHCGTCIVGVQRPFSIPNPLPFKEVTFCATWTLKKEPVQVHLWMMNLFETSSWITRALETRLTIFWPNNGFSRGLLAGRVFEVPRTSHVEAYSHDKACPRNENISNIWQA